MSIQATGFSFLFMYQLVQLCNTMFGRAFPRIAETKDKLPFGQFLSDFSYSELKYALSLQIGIFINQRQK